MDAVIALSRCTKNKKMYGIRFERTGRNWIYTWAFSLQEKTAHNENYDKTRISGAMLEGEEYPGCPHCKSKSFIYCSCGKLSCWDGRSQVASCSWCGYTGRIGGGISSINITSNF